MLPAFTPFTDLPLLCEDLPPCAGGLGAIDDFEVEEIPAYLPGGEGQHTYAWVQKSGLTTLEAIARLCEVVGARAAEAGYAGLKDKHGVTRQWLSFDRVAPERLVGLELPGLKVLSVERHRNRLRTGHLRGNRFIVRLRGTTPDDLVRARRIAARLTREGLPNYYGAQRFGVQRNNAELALAQLRGDAKAPRDRRQRRLLVSSLQSQLFNEVVAERLIARQLRQMRDGDVLQRSDTGGLFASDDLARDQLRIDAGELVITGPMWGPKMTRPRDGSESRRLEDALLERWGLTPDVLAQLGRLGPGTRRPLLAPMDQLSIEPCDDTSLELSFSLPAGSYASVLLRELTRREILGRGAANRACASSEAPGP